VGSGRSWEGSGRVLLGGLLGVSEKQRP